MSHPRRRITDQQEHDFVYGEISETQIREDVMKALNETWELRLDRESCKNWQRLLGIVVTVEGGLIAWLAKELFDCLKFSHLVAKVL